MNQGSGLPSVVIVGRPNVGKSTLFNKLVGRRRAIVGDEPGITRDRIHAMAVHRGRPFEVIDTGGIIPHEAADIPAAIFKQVKGALERAAHIIFVIDGRTEITAADRELAQLLHRLGKSVTLAVNKIDTPGREPLTHDFYSLGMPALFPISAEHNLGLDELLDHVTADFPSTEVVDEHAGEAAIKVAIIGRPNVGKSTLLNALVGKERSIVSPAPGTTRDAVDEKVTYEGRDYIFVDTAGIRRKGKTKLMAEKLSVVMARKHIRLANVVLLMLDASEGIVALDTHIAGYAHQAGRAIIICVNKWDISPEKNRQKFTTMVRDELKFLDYAPIAFLSAKTAAGVYQLFALIREVYNAASQRISTGELNRFVGTLKQDPDQKILYITQTTIRPPTFVLFTDRRKALHFSTERFLINRLRERFGFEGTPIVLKTKFKRR